jgi:glycerol-3-phosphate acyltransferase PlsY
MNIISLLLIIGAYLLGSISSAYVAGRLFGRKDLRAYGSGNLGGSMVWEHVGRWAAIVAGLWDVLKAAIPTWLALQLGFGMPVAAAAGLAAVAGHCWSIFLRFTGGRGLLSFLAVLLVIYPLGGVWFALPVIVGWLFGDSAPWALASLVTLPLCAYLFGGPEIIAPLTGAMTLIALAKRIEANRRPLPPPGRERLQVILRRAFLDRDMVSHKDWIDQTPDGTQVLPKDDTSPDEPFQ